MEFIAGILAVAVFQNALLTRALGASAVSQIARNKKSFPKFFVGILYMTTVMGLLCYLCDRAWGDRGSARIFLPVIYIIALGLVYILTLICLWWFMYNTFKKMRKYIHISAINGAVLGSVLLNSQNSNTLFEYVTLSIGTGLGFMLAVYLVGAAYDKIYSEDAPYLTRGYPLLLIYIGILGMAFFGFTGGRL